ncbi:hypothetical protein [Cryptosporangium sp. NPDC051539]|uniref:hypothetical protein n=1 Tax=Cryptosporangium sp. NPDC051539 TaxID=3363962 RepID=UPI0037A48A21
MSRPLRGRIFYRRFWLNRPGFHSTAFVLSQVELRADGEGLDLIASYELADCRRSAALDFDVYSNSSAAERRNALRKARRLRKSVNAFCDALEAAAEEQKRASKKRPKKAA